MSPHLFPHRLFQRRGTRPASPGPDAPGGRETGPETLRPGGGRGLSLDAPAVLLPEGMPTTLALEAIRARHLEGAVVSGSSAGAAIMSDPMISGGNSAGAMDNGTEAGGVRIRDGLGFFEYGIVDQHFLARGRIGRLVVAARP